MSKKLRIGYIVLCITVIFNFVFENYMVIARTHIGQVSSGLLGKFYDFLVGLDAVWTILFAYLPLIVSVVVSIIVYKFYRDKLSKTTATLAMFGFAPYLLFYTLTSGVLSNIALDLNMMSELNLVMIAVGIIKVIYSIIMIKYMLKDVKRIPVEEDS